MWGGHGWDVPVPESHLAAETSLVAIGRVGVGTFIKEMNNCK